MNEVIYCPECYGSSIELHPRAHTGRCGNCQYTAHLTMFLKAKPHQKKPAMKRRAEGSGVIAGPITIGGGFRWGSTRLG